MTTDDNMFACVRWSDVYKRLRAMAGWLTHDKSVVFDAVSADDLINETLLDFLRSPDGLGWSPSRGKLETFLCTVLKNKFIDCVRRQRRNAGPPQDADLFAVQPDDRQFEQQEAVEQVMQRVSGRKDLEETVIAICESTGEGCQNQEVAAALRITVAEVVNRKKRIRRACEKDSPPQPKPRKEPQVR